jgi:nucleotide-binding universal stress UspA family protein
MILSHAADSSADFIVMGGYGHSRLREFTLGGVTRGILRRNDGADADVALIGPSRVRAVWQENGSLF